MQKPPSYSGGNILDSTRNIKTMFLYGEWDKFLLQEVRGNFSLNHALAISTFFHQDYIYIFMNEKYFLIGNG